LKIKRQSFGVLNSSPVDLFTLSNDQGMSVAITNYGGAITSIRVPDREGNVDDVVLGYETLEEYAKNPRYLGCLVGRHANRIALGKFSLNGINYQLAQNNGANHLHGGPKGFDKKIWKPSETEGNDSVSLRLEYTSVAGEENYPGNLSVDVTYVLYGENAFGIEYHATTDADTIVNLTNHSYFNLAGSGDILQHELTINADSFTPVSKDLIPTGEIRSVQDSPMDFRARTSIGARINEPYDQLGFTGGYDHNFVLNQRDGSVKLAASAYEPTKGRVLEVATTQPGMQFYSGNFLDGSLTGKGGIVYNKYAGFCLETQHFPDTPNHENFPTTLLKPGEDYRHKTRFRFSVQ
jgi:aldose 1-epimerase